MVHPLPIRTPGRISTFPPIQQSSSIKIGWPNSTFFWRDSTLVSCPAVNMLTPVAICTRSPITTRLVSKIVTLDNVSLWYVHVIVIEYELPVNKTITPNYDIASIIREEGWFNECAIPNSADQFAQQLKSLIGYLIIRHSLCVQVVVVGCQTTTQMTRFQELWDGGVVPGLSAKLS